ncbi:MAG: phosphoribosylglycinamide formyltransferase [Planctomycetota bacterium]
MPQPLVVAPDYPEQPIKLAVLLSGGGTTMQNLAECIAAGSLHAEITCVVASNTKAYGIERAKQLGLPCHVLPRRSYDDRTGFSAEVFQCVRAAGADLVCLAGFLSLLVIPDDYAWRVINIHPALLPSFGGKGMHGRHVHEAVIAQGCKVTGCTVHFADPTYDTGPILAQRTCPVLPDDTPQALAERVHHEECQAYPETIRALAEGRVTLDGRVAKVLA